MTCPPFFIYQTFLPSRRRDCFTPTSLSIPTTLSKPHPPPCLTPPFQNRTIPSPFAMLTSVCADTLSHPHHHSPHTNILASLVKGEVLSPENFGRLPEGLLYTHQPLHPHNPLKTPSPLIRTHPHSPFSPRVSPQLLLRFPHRQPRRRPTHNRICSSARRFAPLCLASPAFQPF